MVGIYKISSPSGKVYIGQSWNIKKRWSAHRRRTDYKFKLQASFAKYGIEAHIFEVIHELPEDTTQDVLDRFERLYIKLYKNLGVEILNMKDGGYSCKPSEETRKLMSENQKGKSLEERWGKEAAERQKQKVSEFFKGRIMTDEHKEKIRKANTGNVPSEETRKKISESNKGKLAWNKGKIGAVKRTEEANKKASESMKKRLRDNPRPKEYYDRLRNSVIMAAQKRKQTAA